MDASIWWSLIDIHHNTFKWRMESFQQVTQKSVGLGRAWDWISNNFIGDTNASGPGAILWIVRI